MEISRQTETDLEQPVLRLVNQQISVNVQTAECLREHTDRSEVNVHHVLHHWHEVQLS